jgi:hypothetical protein
VRFDNRFVSRETFGVDLGKCNEGRPIVCFLLPGVNRRWDPFPRNFGFNVFVIFKNSDYSPGVCAMRRAVSIRYSPRLEVRVCLFSVWVAMLFFRINFTGVFAWLILFTCIG